MKMTPHHKRKINVSLIVPFFVMALVFGLLIMQKFQASRQLPVKPPLPEIAIVQKVILFFVDDQQRLAREARDIDPCSEPDECLKSVLDELFGGSVGEFSEVIPEGALIHSARIVNGQAIIDLNRQFCDDLPSGSSAEMLAVYSIVNTVCINFPQVSMVLFSIDGETGPWLRHLDLSEPFEPDFTLEQLPADAAPQKLAPPVQKGKQ